MTIFGCMNKFGSRVKVSKVFLEKRKVRDKIGIGYKIKGFSENEAND